MLTPSDHHGRAAAAHMPLAGLPAASGHASREAGDGWRTLVVQDGAAGEDGIAGVIAHLRWQQEAASDSVSAWRALTATAFDLVLLDLAWMGRSGLELLHRLRRLPPRHGPHWRASVLVLAPGWDARLRLEAFNVGADAFVAQPVHLEELRAVLRALERRRRLHRVAQCMDGDLACVHDMPMAIVGGQHVSLSLGESQLLRALHTAYPDVVTRRALQAALGLAENTVALDVRIHALRRKLGRCAVETLARRGYRLGSDVRLP